MNIKLLKKWRAEANKLFFKDFSVDFRKLIHFNIPELYTWVDYKGLVRFSQDIRWTIFYKDEYISVNDLKSKLQKSYKAFVGNYLEYMTLKTKKKHPYKSFKIKFFKVKRR